MMAYSLGAKSNAKLEGVHPDIVSVVNRAITITDQDFSVHDGLRTIEQQRNLVRKGASKTMESKHLKQPDGYGHAVDLVPWINGQLRWEWKPIFEIASAVRQSAELLGVGLVWGGVWDRPFLALGETPGELEMAVNGYVERRRAKGKTAFIDGPHYQLS